MQLAVISDLPNAAATALTASCRGVTTAYEGAALEPGVVTVEMFGESRRTSIRDLEGLVPAVPIVAVVFAEGQDAFPALTRAAHLRPAAVVVVGGGIKAIVDITGWAREAGLSPAALFFVAGFLVAGTAERVWSEKRALPGAFGGPDPDRELTNLLAHSFPGVAYRSVAEVALSGVNPMLHAAPMILNAMSVERGDPVRLYRDGFGSAVERLVEALDSERLAIAAEWKLTLPSLEGLLDAFYEEEGITGASLREKVNNFGPYGHVHLPDSFDHRFLSHEVEGTLAPMFELSKIMATPSRTLGAVVRLAEILVGTDFSTDAKRVAQQFLALV